MILELCIAVVLVLLLGATLWNVRALRADVRGLAQIVRQEGGLLHAAIATTAVDHRHALAKFARGAAPTRRLAQRLGEVLPPEPPAPPEPPGSTRYRMVNRTMPERTPDPGRDCMEHQVPGELAGDEGDDGPFTRRRPVLVPAYRPRGAS